MANRTKQNTKRTSPTVQEWMPIADVNKSLIIRKDGHAVAAIRVQPVNIDLLSAKERVNKARQLEEVLNAIDYEYQIMSIPKPVDLDGFIAELAEKRKRTEDAIKQKLLTFYMREAAEKAASGEAIERHFYILNDVQATGKKKNQQMLLLIDRSKELALRLSGADLVSHVCDDDELRDLLFIFFNPNHAAYERAPETAIVLPSLFYDEGA